MGVTYIIIEGVLFELFLEQVQDVERGFAGFILKTPALEIGCAPVQRVDFHSRVGIEYVFLRKGPVVGSGCPEVGAESGIGVFLEDTALRQNGVFVCIRSVGVFVEQRVVVPYHPRVGSPVGFCLVGIVGYVVLGC